MEPAQVDLHFAWAKAGVAIYIARTSFEGCYGNVNFRHIAWAGVSTSEKRRRLATEDS